MLVLYYSGYCLIKIIFRTNSSTYNVEINAGFFNVRLVSMVAVTALGPSGVLFDKQSHSLASL